MKKRTVLIAFLSFFFSWGEIWFSKFYIFSSPVIFISSAKAEENENIEIARIAESITVRIEGATQGSGVLIKKDGNLYTVLTAWHVIKDNYPTEEVGIITVDGIEHNWDSKSLIKVANVDMAVFNFKSKKNYAIATLGNLNEIYMGKKSFVAGFPLSSPSIPIRLLRFTRGEVIANANTQIPDGYQLLYSNLTLPGMSGGGVFNSVGELIGIHGRSEFATINDQGKLIASGTNQGIPINFYKNDFIVQKGDFLGDKLLTIDDYLAKKRSIFNKKGKEKELLNIAKKSLELEENSEGYFYKGYAYYQLGNYTKAINNFSKAISVNPSHIESLHYRGYIKANYFKDYRSAINDFSKALSIDPEENRVYVSRGFTYEKIGEYYKAISDYNLSIEIDSTNSIAYRNRGRAYGFLNQKIAACNDFKKSFALGDPIAEDWMKTPGASWCRKMPN